MFSECCHFYEIIVNNRAIILAEFFDLMGDVVNFIDIFWDQSMDKFHQWSLAIMCLSSLSFVGNTFFKKQLSLIKDSTRDNISWDDNIELGLIQKSIVVDKLLVVSKKRKQVYQDIAESMSIILTLIVEDLFSFIFTIIVLMDSEEITLSAQMYNILITGVMIIYQLFCLYVNRANIIDQRRDNLRENMIIDFSCRLKQKRGDRCDDQYKLFVEDIRDKLYLREDSDHCIYFRDFAIDFKEDAFGSNFWLRNSIGMFEFFFKLYPSIKLSEIYNTSDSVDPNESLLTIALDYGHYQIATDIFKKYGGLVTDNWITVQNNTFGGVSKHDILYKLAIHMRPISLVPIYPWTENNKWYDREQWIEGGNPKQEDLSQVYDDQDSQIVREMETPLCKFLIEKGIQRAQLFSNREKRKALYAMVYGEWTEVELYWMKRGLSPLFDGYGPYQRYKREYNDLFLKDDLLKSTQKLDRNIAKFKERFPSIDINTLIITERWGQKKWWFNITILHDNILERNLSNVKDLIEKEGADPWIKTGAGENCLQIARKVNAEQIVKYFEDNYPDMAIMVS